MKLVSNWKSAWRFLSVQLGLLGTAISGMYATMYDTLKSDFAPETVATITAGVFISGIIGRVISQGLDEGDKK